MTMTEEEKAAAAVGGPNRKVKKNFSLKKQLSKADTKLRDLFGPISRRGSGTGGSSAGSAGLSGTVSPHLSDSKPVSPQEEQTAFHFPDPPDAVSSAPLTVVLSGSDPVVVTACAESLDTNQAQKESSVLFDADGIPIRPPRRLKKSLSAAAHPAHRAATSNRDSGWKRTWYSSDESASILTATHILDLRFDPADEPCHTGFLDSLVRKFSKTLTPIIIQIQTPNIFPHQNIEFEMLSFVKLSLRIRIRNPFF